MTLCPPYLLEWPPRRSSTRLLRHLARRFPDSRLGICDSARPGLLLSAVGAATLQIRPLLRDTLGMPGRAAVRNAIEPQSRQQRQVRDCHERRVVSNPPARRPARVSVLFGHRP